MDQLGTALLLLLSALGGWAQINTGLNQQESIGMALGRIFDASLDVFAPVSPVLDDSLCRTHGLLLQKGVKQGQLWALHMLDASSKLPSGLLTGNLIQLGNVDQCLAVNHVDPELGPIRGQHCQVSLGVENAMSVDTFARKLESGSFKGTGLDDIETLLSRAQFSDALARLGATWSVCLPASCSPGDLQLHLQAALPGTIQVRVGRESCFTHEGRPWNSKAILSGLVLCCVGVLVAVGSVYTLLTDATSPRNQTLVALSLQENWTSLLRITRSNDNLASFHGLRCISILWTILVHHFVFHMNTPSVNYRTLEAFARDWTHLLVANGSLAVDSLFVLSGALVTVNFLRDREQNAKFSLWREYLKRYVRLTPTHLVMMLIFSTMLGRVGDAPTFRPNMLHMEATCERFGWLGPLYLTNYLDLDKTCLGQVWSNNVDMHLFWISPLLLFPLWRSPRLGGVLLLLLGVASTGMVFSEAFHKNITPTNTFFTAVNSFELITLYYKTHVRATPWLVGVALGYLLHKTKDRQDVPISGFQTALGWTSSLLLTSYAFLSAHAYYQLDAHQDRLYTALYVALMRPTWAVGVAWALFACERRRGGVLNAFLAWPGWQVASKLCYAVFFTNLGVVSSAAMLKKTPQFYSNFNAIVEYCGVVVISFMAAAILHLLVEAPCIRLYHLHMRSEPKQLKKVT